MVNRANSIAYAWAIRGFLRICWPNRSVLNIGFRTPDPEPSEPLYESFFFADGSCALENLSVVARGMAEGGKKIRFKDLRVSINFRESRRSKQIFLSSYGNVDFTHSEEQIAQKPRIPVSKRCSRNTVSRRKIRRWTTRRDFLGKQSI